MPQTLSRSTQPALTWQWCTLDDLAPLQLYTLFAARQAVFIVEQKCAYPDLDGADIEAEHLIAWSHGDVAACLRLLAPGVKFSEASLGRIVTTLPFRGTGLGRELIWKGLARAQQRYPQQPIRIGAQAHLERFYGSFGFARVSDVYSEDGIPHIEMLRAAPR